MTVAIPKVSFGPPTFRIKENDTQPPITFVATDEDQQVVSLIGATGVQFRYRLRNAAANTAVARTATIVAADTGELRYDWVLADTATPGDYYGEWIVSFPSSQVRTFPVRGFQLITIEPILS